jgi:Sec-independent protein translocase protein TatA
MPNNTELLCLILEFQSRSLIVQGLLQAEAAKEYKADWLKNTDTVVRDGTGKFAKKGASVAQSVQNTTAILKQGFDLTGDTIQSLIKDPEFRKRAGLAVGLPMAKLISNLATQARLNPKLTEKLDEWIANATKEFADQYGDDKNPMAQAIRKANLAQPPKDASFNEKMEFRVAQYAAYKEALDSPENFSKRDETIGKAAAAAIPIGVSLAIALGFEVAIPLFLAQSVNWATVLSSVALGEAADFAVQKGMDKLEINNPALRIGASMVAGILAGGLVTGVNNKIKKTNKALNNIENKSEEVLEQQVKQEVKEEVVEEPTKQQVQEESENLIEKLEKNVKYEPIESLTEQSTQEVHLRSYALGNTGIQWREIIDNKVSYDNAGYHGPDSLRTRMVNPKTREIRGISSDMISYQNPCITIIFNRRKTSFTLSGLEHTQVTYNKYGSRSNHDVYNAMNWTINHNKDNIVSSDKDLMLRNLISRSLLDLSGKGTDFIKTINESISPDGLEKIKIDMNQINQLVETSEAKIK